MTKLDGSRNDILRQLPPREWDVLSTHAERVRVPSGQTLVDAGAVPETIYFPESGLASVVASMDSGHHLQVAAVGREGIVGAATVILNIPRMPYWAVAELEFHACACPAEWFLECFHSLEVLRRRSLDYLGRLLQEIARSAVCNRFHSQRERLAHWLLVTAERSGQSSLELTHDFIAQMVGGARPAVTAALAELRQAGAITHLRGRIEVVDRNRLAACACECSRRHPLEEVHAPVSTQQSWTYKSGPTPAA